MRLKSLELRGITRFNSQGGPARPPDVAIDFDGLGEGLVAIAGKNGAGKTTILEAAFAALHLEFPTRPGSLYGVAHGKDAYIAAEFSGAKSYRVKVAVDAIRQTSEAYLYGEGSGGGSPIVPLTPTGKVREYTAAILERFGSPKLMLSAALSCQSRRGSFLELSKVERKELFAEMLDTAGLQRLSESARDKARQAEAAIEKLRGGIEAYELEIALHEPGDMEEVRRSIDRAQAEIINGEITVGLHRRDLAEVEKAIATAEEVTRRRAGAASEIATLEATIATMQRVVDAADGEVAAVRDRLATERRTLEAGLATWQRAADAEASEIAGAKNKADLEIRDAQVEADRLPEYVEAARYVEELAKSAAVLEAERSQAQMDVQEAAEEVDRARAQVQELEQVNRDRTAAELQATRLKAASCADYPRWAPLVDLDDGGLECMNHAAAPVKLIRACSFPADARADADKLPGLVAKCAGLAGAPHAFEAAVEAKAHTVEQVESIDENLRANRAKSAAAAVLAGRVDVAKAAAVRIETIRQQFSLKQEAIAQDAAEARRVVAETLASIARLEAMSGEDNPEIQVVRKRARDAELVVVELYTKSEGLRKSLDAEDAPDVNGLTRRRLVASCAVESCLARIEANRQTANERDRELTRLTEADKRHKVRVDAVAKLRQEQNKVGRDVAEWKMLERAFGRDGAQALEIDAAGPEVSDTTTQLLRSCFGERFAVEFVTQQLRADGKGQKEVFDVTIRDYERGRDGASVDTLSGGEKTIVSEAISLALAIYSGKHSEHSFGTLWRDETMGSLDPDNAQRYLTMLRKARVMAGARQLIYIAQQPECWAGADAILWVENGRVEVRS